MSTIMNSICGYLAECPALDPTLPFYLDYVGESDCYSVTTVPNTPYTKDILGNKTYTVTFQFAYRAAISNDIERGRAIELLEALCAWIDKQNERGNYPALPDGAVGKQIRVIETGALDEVTEERTTGIYAAQLEFIYKQRRK